MPVGCLAAPALAHLLLRYIADLTLVVPAAVGGGWELTSKAMIAALEHMAASIMS